jgi:hypothetical protein
VALEAQLRFVRRFRSVQPDPQLRPAAEELTALAGRLQALRDSALGPDLADRLRQGLVEGMVWLDALPRDDPSWQGAHRQRRPNLLHISGLATRCLNGLVPPLPWAPWAHAAEQLFHNGSSWGLRAWQHLAQQGRLNVEWPVRAAYFVQTRLYVPTGHSNAAELSSFLHERDLGLELRDVLLGFYPADRVSPWAQSVCRQVPAPLTVPAGLCASTCVRGLLTTIHREGALKQLPILADALEDAGWADARALAHLRAAHEGRAGCWLVGQFLAGPEERTD